MSKWHSSPRKISPPWARVPTAKLQTKWIIYLFIQLSFQMGKRIKLLKTLLSSVCERDCHYCAFRAGRDTRRATFQPEEFARLFIMLSQKGITEGIFLSSGVAGGGIRTQDKLLDTADILRNKLGFQGYIHLKIMPGSEHAQVERAMQLADRVSVNLEAPNPARLADLAPGKNFSEELLLPLKWMAEIRRSNPIQHGWKDHWPSSATQFVVGGAGESDLEIMSTSEYLYHRLGFKTRLLLQLQSDSWHPAGKSGSHPSNSGIEVIPGLIFIT